MARRRRRTGWLACRLLLLACALLVTALHAEGRDEDAVPGLWVFDGKPRVYLYDAVDLPLAWLGGKVPEEVEQALAQSDVVYLTKAMHGHRLLDTVAIDAYEMPREGTLRSLLGGRRYVEAAVWARLAGATPEFLEEAPPWALAGFLSTAEIVKDRPWGPTLIDHLHERAKALGKKVVELEGTKETAEWFNHIALDKQLAILDKYLGKLREDAKDRTSSLDGNIEEFHTARLGRGFRILLLNQTSIIEGSRIGRNSTYVPSRSQTVAETISGKIVGQLEREPTTTVFVASGWGAVLGRGGLTHRIHGSYFRRVKGPMKRKVQVNDPILAAKPAGPGDLPTKEELERRFGQSTSMTAHRRAAAYVRARTLADPKRKALLEKLKKEDVLLVDSKFSYDREVLNALGIPHTWVELKDVEPLHKDYARSMKPHPKHGLSGYKMILFSTAWTTPYRTKVTEVAARYFAAHLNRGGHMLWMTPLGENLAPRLFGWKERERAGRVVPSQFLAWQVRPFSTARDHELLEGVFLDGVDSIWKARHAPLPRALPDGTTRLFGAKAPFTSMTMTFGLTVDRWPRRCTYVGSSPHEQEGNLAGTIGKLQLLMNAVLRSVEDE